MISVTPYPPRSQLSTIGLDLILTTTTTTRVRDRYRARYIRLYRSRAERNEFHSLVTVDESYLFVFVCFFFETTVKNVQSYCRVCCSNVKRVVFRFVLARLLHINPLIKYFVYVLFSTQRGIVVCGNGGNQCTPTPPFPFNTS